MSKLSGWNKNLKQKYDWDFLNSTFDDNIKFVKNFKKGVFFIKKKDFKELILAHKKYKENSENIIIDFYKKKEFIKQDFINIDKLKQELEQINIFSKRLESISDSHYIFNSSMHAEIKQMNEMIEEMDEFLNTLNQSLLHVDSSLQNGLGFLDEVKLNFLEIESNSKKLKEVTALIEDVSDRVNLLSLNASIEAARAGQYGMGFSVVASEINKLATETDKRTKDIAKLLKVSKIQIEQGAEKVLNSTYLFSSIYDSVNSFKESILKVSEIMKLQILKKQKIKEQTYQLDETSDEIYQMIKKQKQGIEHVSSITDQLKESKLHFFESI